MQNNMENVDSIETEHKPTSTKKVYEIVDGVGKWVEVEDKNPRIKKVLKKYSRKQKLIAFISCVSIVVVGLMSWYLIDLFSFKKASTVVVYLKDRSISYSTTNGYDEIWVRVVGNKYDIKQLTNSYEYCVTYFVDSNTVVSVVWERKDR